MSSIRWTKHCKTPKEKQEMKSNLAAAKVAFDVLVKLLEQDVSSAKKESKAKENYDKAAWPYLQADLIGTQRAYEKVIDLLKST